MSTIIYHNHHILPKHAGGTDHPDNLVRLSVADHAEAHRKLYEEYGRWQDKLAYRSLSGLIGKDEIIQELQKHINYEAIRESNRNRVWSDESRQKISNSNKGRTMSDHNRKKISEAVKISNSKRIWSKESLRKTGEKSKLQIRTEKQKNRKRNPLTGKFC